MALAEVHAKRDNLRDINGEYISGEEALRIMTFYMCSRCASPYYGGRRECNIAGRVGEGGRVRNGVERRLCPGCVVSGSGSMCKKHGMCRAIYLHSNVLSKVHSNVHTNHNVYI
eukprot:GHVQ01008905.1.p1 GENE.GHVQ01008905.1~~GHVQ01008905.1.p1  ORF type:complete len:114 (-),score=12.60 GHVQ01008905.1:1067-1408(-)